MRKIALFLALLSLLAGGLYLIQRAGIVPPRWDPWALPDPRQPPGLLTRWQLARLRADIPACLAWLRDAGVAVTPLPDRAGPEPGCGLHGAATLRRSLLRYNSTVTASCPLLAGLILYERHVLIPAAERHLGSAVVSVRHLGTFACRAVRTPTGMSGRRSQHATANAIDLAGVTLADGRETLLQRDWRADPEGHPTAMFWREAWEGACEIFPTTLGPSFNSLHQDHFHLGMGRFGLCR